MSLSKAFLISTIPISSRVAPMYRADRNSGFALPVHCWKDRKCWFCLLYTSIPVVNDSQGEKIKKIDQIDGFCIYYRGPYEKFPLVYEQLLDYANKNNCDCADYFLNIFMEGPPTHGGHKEAYITQIVLPIVQEVRDISAAAFWNVSPQKTVTSIV